MSIPTYDKFIEPVLRYLSEHPDGAVAKEVYEATAITLSLTEAEKQELLPSGAQAVYKNRAGWAHDRLKRAGLSVSPKRGYWQLTKEGMEYAKSKNHPLLPSEIESLAIGYNDIRLKQPDNDNHEKNTISQKENKLFTETASPEERLGLSLTEIREAVAAEILELLMNVSPTYFETIVLDVLHRMGYGASRNDLQRVGGSGDGGIDGIISLDKLGLEKVYVQAKRWQNSVGRPEIQAFYGALAGQRANKGVFITTSSYTTQAVDFAKSVERIVLVDGQLLARHMMDHEVGVSSRTIKVPKIDTDYFDE